MADQASLTQTGSSLHDIIIEIGNNLTNFFGDKQDRVIDDLEKLVSGTGNLLAVYLSLWLMFETYKMLYGKGEQTIGGFLWIAFVKFIFILLALNASDWVSTVVEAMKEIRAYTKGTSFGAFDPFTQLGLIALNIGTLATFVSASAENSSVLYGFLMYFCVFFIFLGFFIGAFPYLKTIVVNWVSFFILSALTPLAFYFLIFKVSNNIFKQWLQMIIGNLITLLIFSLLTSFVLNWERSVLEELTKLVDNVPIQVDPFAATGLCIIFGILTNAVCSLAVSLAEKLSVVSFESATNSSFGRAMGLAGSAVGVAGGGAILGARGTLGAARGAIGVGSAGIKGAKAAKKGIGKLIGRK